jgi:hypothetical protein
MPVFETHRDPGDENTSPVKRRFILADVVVGKALRVKTRNSTYELRKQAGGVTWKVEQTAAKDGGYTLVPNPVVASIANFELLPGVVLAFWRDSPIVGAIRLTRTSAIKSVEEVK